MKRLSYFSSLSTFLCLNELARLPGGLIGNDGILCFPILPVIINSTYPTLSGLSAAGLWVHLIVRRLSVQAPLWAGAVVLARCLGEKQKLREGQGVAKEAPALYSSLPLDKAVSCQPLLLVQGAS